MYVTYKFCAIFYKGLEYLWILVGRWQGEGFLEPVSWVPRDCVSENSLNVSHCAGCFSKIFFVFQPSFF